MPEDNSNSQFNHSNQSSNVSDEEKWQFLYWLQGKNDLINIPSFTFLGLLFVCGLIGNSLILIVYSRKKSKTPTVILIQFIAVMDTITNLLIVPGAIYAIARSWTYTNVALCKAHYFFSCFISWTSAILLMVVAIIRYRKICKPFGRQLTNTETKIICVCVVGLSLVFSLPFAIFYGQITVDTGHKGILGYDCGVAAEYHLSIWPTVCHGLYIVGFLSCCATLTTLYTLIGIEARKHRVPHASQHITEKLKLIERSRGETTTSTDESSSQPKTDNCIDLSDVEDSRQDRTGFYQQNSHVATTTAVPALTTTAVPTLTTTAVSTLTTTAVPTLTATAVPTLTATAVPTLTTTAVPTLTATAVPTLTTTAVPTLTTTAVPTLTATAVPTLTTKTDKASRLHANIKPQKTKRAPTSGRTTRMLLATSIIYIISYLSTLIMVLMNDVYQLTSRVSAAEVSVLHLLIVFYLINSAANPFIYSLCNPNFRKDCLAVFHRLTRRNI